MVSHSAMHLNIDRTHLQLGRRFAVHALFAGILSWCVVAVRLCAVASCTVAHGQPTITVTEQDSGKTVSVAVGQEVLVRLPSNPTTGYQWSVLGSPAPLEFVKSDYATDPQAAGRMGAGGTQTLRFTAKSPGKVQLKLGYGRPWEKGAAPAKTFTAMVIVK